MPATITPKTLRCLNEAFSITPKCSTKYIEESCKITWDELLRFSEEGLVVAISERVPVICPDTELWQAGPNLTARLEKEQARFSLYEKTSSNERRYLRLGAWCDCGRSFNSALGKFEVGISAYRASLDGDKWRPLDECFWNKNYVTRKSSTPWYLVHGQEVDLGFDGEILLKDVKIEAQLAWDESASVFAIQETLSALEYRRHEDCHYRALHT